MTLRRTELPKMSAKRRDVLAKAGITNPTSTFKPKPPKMATAKRPKDTGPVRSTRELVAARSGGTCELVCFLSEANRAWAYEWGLILSANANPARVPVRGTRHDSGPVWLLPDGSWLRYEEACA